VRGGAVASGQAHSAVVVAAETPTVTALSTVETPTAAVRGHDEDLDARKDGLQ